ncbi:MAG: sigma 54-interacting transcriptional regulator [Pseudomonadota bacterium]
MMMDASVPQTASVGASGPCCGLVGQSAALRHVLRQLELVASMDSTVLVIGETGTGKELVANAVHQQSTRRGQAFVPVNCAAIPPTLLESELFGHERGAFTGAHARRAGRFELAHDGTLFLDEIGELPLTVQPRLLRALQERRFERLGSSRTVHANVRFVVATNRDLAIMCADGAFREDLFYRLNVFPILLPPLRERRDDIPLLVHHFVAQFASKMNRGIRVISNGTMSILQDHEWPGNVRELQNVIERAVILADGPELKLEPLALSALARPVARAGVYRSLDEVNRAHIVEVLRSTRGVVAGPHGAAARLGLKRSTLLYRMKKLGVRSAAPGSWHDETVAARADAVSTASERRRSEANLKRPTPLRALRYIASAAIPDDSA